MKNNYELQRTTWRTWNRLGKTIFVKETFQHWDGIAKTLKKLWHRDYSNLAAIWNTTSTYAILTPFMKFTSTSKRMIQNIQKEPHYTALVKVLDRCTNKITSFWIKENYRCMLTHATGVGTYACVEFRNLSITKTKWVNERWTISGTTAMKYGNRLTTSTKTTKKNLPMQNKRKMKNRINNNIK